MDNLKTIWPTWETELPEDDVFDPIDMQSWFQRKLAAIHDPTCKSLTEHLGLIMTVRIPLEDAGDSQPLLRAGTNRRKSVSNCTET